MAKKEKKEKKTSSKHSAKAHVKKAGGKAVSGGKSSMIKA
jgi:hypothetical protein